QAGLRAAIDRDADFLLRHDDAGVKPPGAIRNGLDSGFVKRVACPCAAPPPCTQATRRTAHRDCAPPRRPLRMGTDESTQLRNSSRQRRRTPGRGISLPAYRRRANRSPACLPTTSRSARVCLEDVALFLLFACGWRRRPSRAWSRAGLWNTSLLARTRF